MISILQNTHKNIYESEIWECDIEHCQQPLLFLFLSFHQALEGVLQINNCTVHLTTKYKHIYVSTILNARYLMKLMSHQLTSNLTIPSLASREPCHHGIKLPCPVSLPSLTTATSDAGKHKWSHRFKCDRWNDFKTNFIKCIRCPQSNRISAEYCTVTCSLESY